MCVCAPASLQLPNVYVVEPLVCGVGALTEFVEPMMTCRVNGVAWLVEPTVSGSPDGLLANVRFTVCGCRSSVVAVVSPRESVAVRRSCRYDGYSWSGAVIEPPATPVSVCTKCVWQLPGAEQCCSSTSHFSAVAGNAPSCGSVAWPVKVIGSPTFQVNPVAGVSMTAVGPPAPAVMGTVDVLLAPSVSVTLSRAVNVPFAAYVWLVVTPVASNVPSFSKSHW